MITNQIRNVVDIADVLGGKVTGSWFGRESDQYGYDTKVSFEIAGLGLIELMELVEFVKLTFTVTDDQVWLNWTGSKQNSIANHATIIVRGADIVLH